MASGVNKAIILGNVGQDPEIKYATNGNAIANISIATSESWKDKQTGQKHEKTEWHKVSAFGRLAEIIGEYVKKGSKVYIEGKIQTRKWQDKNGEDRYTTEIVANELQLLDSRSDASNQPAQAPQQERPQAQQAPRTAPPPPPQFDDIEDGIPFADPYKHCILAV